MMTPIAITARAALGLTARRSIRPAVQCVCPSHPSVVVDGVHRYQSSGITKASSFQKKALEVLRSQSDANGKSDKPSEGMGIKVKKPLKKKSFFGAVSDSDQSVSDAASPKTDDTTAKDLDKPEIEKPTPEAIAPPAPPKEQNRRLSSEFLHEFAPKIVVLGVGGAGGNALNNMVAKELQGVEFVALNTDAQHLASTLTDQRIQLGAELTRGLGCGANPDAGRLAAEESREQIQEQLKDAHLVFITAGMGGGTGTGAAPVIADICYEMGILTVGVVTLPFSFEGSHRKRLALEGIERIQNVVDTLIVIPNQNLFQIAGPETTFVDAFQMADDVLLGGVKSITDLMTSPGLINLDFADVQAVMVGMGNALLGTGVSDDKEERAVQAAERALQNPLLGDSLDIATAKGILVNITGGSDMTLFEVDKAAQMITKRISDDSANIIFGSAYDASLEGSIRVSVVATGIENPSL